MAFQNYSDAFGYTERITMEYAKGLCEQIANTVIETLKSTTEGLQSGSESGLTNIWQEISVQFQTEFSGLWDLYDELVTDAIDKEIRKIPEYGLAAIQYSIDFSESDSEFCYEVDEIIAEIKSNYVYSAAVNNRDEAVKYYLGV